MCEFERANLDEPIPKVECIYFLMNGDELIYVGSTVNLHRRISRHDTTFNPNILLGGELVVPREFDNILYHITKRTKERLKLEKYFVEQLYPKYNFNGMFHQFHYFERTDR